MLYKRDDVEPATDDEESGESTLDIALPHPGRSNNSFEGIDVYRASERLSLPLVIGNALAHGLERLTKLSRELKEIVAPTITDYGWVRERSTPSAVDADESGFTLLQLGSQLGSLGAAVAILGLSDEGHPVVLDFDDSGVSHVLVSGSVGAGKTTLLATLATSLAVNSRQSNVQLVVIDPHDDAESSGFTALEPLSYLPHMLAPVVFGHPSGIEALALLVDEMEYRQGQDIRYPRVVVMIEDVVELLELGGAHAAGLMARLAQKGQESGMRLVLTTDRPAAPQLDVLLRANLPVRIVGTVPDQRVAAAASGAAESGAEFLRSPGDFMAFVDGDITTRFRSVRVGNREMHLIQDRLQRSRPRPLLARPLSDRGDSILRDRSQKGEVLAPKPSEAEDESENPPWFEETERSNLVIYDLETTEIDEA